MLALPFVFLLAAALFGLGFAAKWLLLAAGVVAIVWLIGFVSHSRSGTSAAGERDSS